ncbi:hypothetical protein amrb99_34660 [Actinomadura sp. RB99]|uniref:hypothetical protein n=1 Tax=Actinomadura sp. RB99 TaxID=2691577 RepID=UPI001689B1FF|nr:hypothetical protein [Actinomadura sp. RB99]MBD2894540.1 hypothetical protein [Actinomadura sp. RB99]
MNAGIGAVELWAAKQALDTAKKMKGDESAVIAVADKWRRAAERIRRAENSLSESWNSLSPDWSGGGYNAYRWHMTRNARIAEANSDALLAAGEALLDLALQVVSAYNAAVDLTTLAAGRIEPALGGMGWTSNKKDDKPTITNALIDYVEAVNKLDNDLRTAVAGQKVGLAKFASSLSKLNEPSILPKNATNPKVWISGA